MKAPEGPNGVSSRVAPTQVGIVPKSRRPAAGWHAVTLRSSGSACSFAGIKLVARCCINRPGGRRGFRRTKPRSHHRQSSGFATSPRRTPGWHGRHAAQQRVGMFFHGENARRALPQRSTSGASRLAAYQAALNLSPCQRRRLIRWNAHRGGSSQAGGHGPASASSAGSVGTS